jgi:hypothetical protein
MSDAHDVRAFLEALGFSEELGTFKGRLRIQKTVYLLKEFGVDLGFNYNWYIHGPYCPSLTGQLFNQQQSTQSGRPLKPEELQAVNELRNFLGEDLYSADALELLVSLIFLIRYCPPEYDSKQKIIAFLHVAKPQFSHEQIEAAWTKIEGSGRWKSSIAKLRPN